MLLICTLGSRAFCRTQKTKTCDNCHDRGNKDLGICQSFICPQPRILAETMRHLTETMKHRSKNTCGTDYVKIILGVLPPSKRPHSKRPHGLKVLIRCKNSPAQQTTALDHYASIMRLKDAMIILDLVSHCKPSHDSVDNDLGIISDLRLRDENYKALDPCNPVTLL